MGGRWRGAGGGGAVTETINPFESSGGALALLAALADRMNPLAAPPPSGWNPPPLTADERRALRALVSRLAPALPWVVGFHGDRGHRLYNSDIVTAWKSVNVREDGKPYKNPPPPTHRSVTFPSIYGALSADAATFVVAACNSLPALLDQVDALERRLAEITGGR